MAPTAQRAAWSGRLRGRPLALALHGDADAIGAGGDTDTVAGIAGALAGACWGLTGVRDDRISRVHGWPGLGIDDLAELGRRLVS